MELRGSERPVHAHRCPFGHGRRISKRFTLLSAALAGVLALFATVSSYAFVRLSNGPAGLFWGSGGRSPIFFAISTARPAPGITDGSADAAIRLAFKHWQDVPSTGITFQEDQRPTSRARTDWTAPDVHLVWFDTSDASGMFSQNSGLVAVTPVSFAADGSIIDADIIFNAKDHQFSTTGTPGTFDVQNIGTHECGHFIGLDHSAILGATMNPYAIQQDTRLRTLEADDVAGASTIYPRSGFGLGSISGKLVDSKGQGISGAHVVAESAGGTPVSSCLSQSDGRFQVKGLPQGSYVLYAEPLDGPVVGQNLSLSTSGLRIDTNFGTTFVGGAANPTSIFVNTGLDATVGTITARAAVGMTIQGCTPNAISAGDKVTISAWGSGFDRRDSVQVVGDGFVTKSLTVTSTSISLTVQVDPLLTPTLRSIRLVRSTTGDCRVLTGAVEIRQAAPALNGVDPARGKPGDTIVLTGRNLGTNAAIIMGTGLTLNVAGSGTAASFACPNLPDGTYDITFQNEDGQSASILQGFVVAGGTTTAGTDPTTGTTGTTGTGSGTGTSTTTQTTASAGGATATPSGFVSGASSGGGGGGGGGCALEPSRGGSPAAILPLGLAVAALVVRRKRAA